jgi:alkanesulfonate monooxygenase SsuD/methylene tetrahydromethanopterin reductase-like flavin-dependent oxidoreductase (luciferase family)
VTDAASVKTGVLVWNQRTDWPAMSAAAQRIDALDYDSLWTWDHLYPIVGDIDGPFLEGYVVIAGWSQVTTGPSIGLLVGANTFRNPALVVKMITTLDHLSRGRAVLGIGAAWFDTEHAAFGIEFGRSFGERIGWLDEAVALMRTMLHEPSASARGPRYTTRDVMNLPAPVQAHLPILIGGSGERKTLKTVARYADMWNVANVTPEEAARKDGILRRWCDDVGRDTDEIERTVSLGPLVIRDDPADVAAWVASFYEANPGTDRTILSGSADEIAEVARAYVARGFRHVIYHLAPPYDEETLQRFAEEVRPQLGS